MGENVVPSVLHGSLGFTQHNIILGGLAGDHSTGGLIIEAYIKKIYIEKTEWSIGCAISYEVKIVNDSRYLGRKI